MQPVVSIAATAHRLTYCLVICTQDDSVLRDPGPCWGHVCLSEPGELPAWSGMVTSLSDRKPNAY